MRVPNSKQRYDLAIMPSEESQSAQSMADTDPGEKRSPLWLPLVGILILIGYLTVEWHLLATLGFPLDDSWIHLQFARNLAEGQGLAYQNGEWIAASTAPLWTALLALLFALPVAPTTPVFPVIGAKVLGGLFYLATGRALFSLTSELGSPRSLATLASVLFYGSSWMAWSALSGMEIPLFCWLTVSGAVHHLRERRDGQRPGAATRPPLSLLFFALAVLARPEGFLLLLAAAVDRALVWSRDLTEGAPLALRRPFVGNGAALLLGLAIVAAVVVPTGLLFWWLGDSPLPTTYGTKAGWTAGWGIHRSYLLTALSILFKPQPILTLLAGGGVLLAITRLGGRRDGGLLLPAWMLGLPLGYALLSPAQGSPLVGNFGRYLFPVLPFLIVLGIQAVEPVYLRLAGGLRLAFLRRPVLLPLRALCVLLLLTPTFLDLVQGSTLYGRSVANIHDGDVRIAHWLRDHVPPDALVAVQDIGAIGYLAPQPLLDLSALITPEIRTYGATEGLAGIWRFLEEQRPDLVIAFPHWAPPLTTDADRLRPILRLKIEDNIALGSDTLIVYTTPWTRFPLHPPGEGGRATD
jgi:hypothetical protein